MVVLKNKSPLHPLITLISVLAVLCAALFYSGTPAEAQQPAFYTDVSPKSGTQDETFVFSVVIENATSDEMPRLSGGDDFEIRLIGPTRSSVLSNGMLSTQTAYNYRLYPKKTGLLEGPVAQVIVNGEKLLSTAQKIKVMAPDPANPAGSDSIFIQQSIQPEKGYLGQQFVHNLSLFAAVPVYEPNFSDATFDGFWTEPIGGAKRTTSYVKNRPYTVLKTPKALFPTRSGTIQIEPRTMTLKTPKAKRSRAFPFGMRDPLNDPFGGIFGMPELESKTLTSNRITLEVSPLPPQPAGFSNWGIQSVLVGKTAIELEYDDKPLETGQSKTVRLTVQSTGNLNPLTEAPLETTNNYKIYQESPEEHKLESNGMLLFRKTFTISVIPLKPGKLEMPPFRIGYFDPETAEYKTAETRPLVLNVSGADLRTVRDEAAPPRPVPPKSETVLPPEKDLTYREETTFERLSSRVSLSLSLLILCAALVVVAAAGAVLAVRAGKTPLRKAASKIKNAPDTASLAAAFNDYILMRINERNSGLHGEQLRAVLKRSITNPDLLFNVQTLQDDIDAALYSPSGSGSFERLKSRALNIIKNWP